MLASNWGRPAGPAPHHVLLACWYLASAATEMQAAAQSMRPVFDFRLDGFHVTPAIVRRGDLVRLTFLSKDATYGVYIPVLKLKGKATPDRPVTFEFAASSEGEYEMRCTKYWGFKHWSENGKIVVE